MSRKLEKIFGIIGAFLITVTLGSLAILANQITQKEYEQTLAPLFHDSLKQMSMTAQFEAFQTLGAWFGMTVMTVLLLTATATVLVKKYPKKAGLLYVAIGLIALLGSQLLAFPFAFCFFVAGVLSFMKKGGQVDGNQHSQSHFTRI